MAAVGSTADSLGEVSIKLNRAHKKIADHLKDIGRLSDELIRKDSMIATLKCRLLTLSDWLETSHTGELHRHSSAAAAGDTLVWEPSGTLD